MSVTLFQACTLLEKSIPLLYPLDSRLARLLSRFTMPSCSSLSFPVPAPLEMGEGIIGRGATVSGAPV